MKPLIILSACLLVLSSCVKECPVPDPDPDPTDAPDPYPYDDPGNDTPPDNDPPPDNVPTPDPGDDGPPPSCYNFHGGRTVSWMEATSLSVVG